MNRVRRRAQAGAAATAAAAVAVSAILHAGAMALLSDVKVEDAAPYVETVRPAPGAGAIAASHFAVADPAAAEALSQIDEAPPAERADGLSPDPEPQAAGAMPASAAADPAAARLSEAPAAVLPQLDFAVRDSALDLEPPSPEERPAPPQTAAAEPERYVPALPDLPAPAVRAASVSAAAAAEAGGAAKAAADSAAAAAKALAGIAAPPVPDIPALGAGGFGDGRIPLLEAARAGAGARAAAAGAGKVAENVDPEVVEAEKAAVRKLIESDAASGDGGDAGLEGALEFGLKSAVHPAEPDVRYFELHIDAGTVRPLPAVPKDFVLAIDTSGSMTGTGLESVQEFAGQALRAALEPGDRFNVVWFTEKFRYLYPMWKERSEEAIGFAAAQTAAIKADGMTDFFSVIRSVHTLPREPERPLIVMAVTDGEATAGLRKSAEIAGRFSRLNGGLVSLNVYAVGTNDSDRVRMEMLQMLTVGNRGNVYLQSQRNLRKYGERLPEAAGAFREPVLTDISVTFASGLDVDAYPALPQHLYRSRSVTLCGRCPATCRELVFSVRGLNGGRSLSGLFKVPFGDGAPQGGAAARIRRMWALMKQRSIMEDDAAAPSPDKKQALREHSAKYLLPLPEDWRAGAPQGGDSMKGRRTDE